MIRNIDWVVGMVVYTGKHTKIQQNGAEARFKISRVEKMMHRMIVIIFFVQLGMSVLAGLVKTLKDMAMGEEKFDHFLEGITGQKEGALWLIIIRYFILLSTMIPISLLINLEMVRLMQAYLISHNLDLMNKKENR